MVYLHVQIIESVDSSVYCLRYHDVHLKITVVPMIIVVPD